MMLLQETKNIQNQLATYCRTGKLTEIPGVVTPRVHHYRRLVFNVVNNTMKQAFPIAHKLLSEDEWHIMANDFFANHDCQTAQIWKLPYEFYQYISENEYDKKYNKPYLSDLLLFEWMEIEVHTMPDETIPAITFEGDLFQDILVINPEYRIISLTYPVHIHPAGESVKKKGQYYVMVARDREDGQVNFFDVSPFFVFLLEKLSYSKYSLNQILSDARKVFSIPNTTDVKEPVENFLEDMKKDKIVLGFKL